MSWVRYSALYVPQSGGAVSSPASGTFAGLFSLSGVGAAFTLAVGAFSATSAWSATGAALATASGTAAGVFALSGVTKAIKKASGAFTVVSSWRGRSVATTGFLQRLRLWIAGHTGI